MPGVSYICAGKVFIKNSLSYSQLGPHFVLDSTSDPRMVASKLLEGINSKNAKDYNIAFGDVCIIMYRERNDSLLSSVRRPERLSDNIDDKIRTFFGLIKSAYLSENYFPFSMDEGKYGREVDFYKPATGKNVKTFLYNKRKKYLISREPLGNGKVLNKVYEYLKRPKPEIFDLSKLTCLFEFEDTDNGSTFKRRLNDLVLTFDKKDKLLYYEALFPNTTFVQKRNKSFPHFKKIITMDIETIDDNGSLIPCAIGFYDGVKSMVYTADFSSSVLASDAVDKMFKQAFDDLLVSKYHGYTVYIHNFKGFDGVFLGNFLERSGFQVKSFFKDTQNLLCEKVSSVKGPRTAYLKKGRGR